jgi:NADPH2:quinone reductase
MRAIVTTGDARLFETVEVAPPTPERSQAVVAVQATSLNRDELGSLVVKRPTARMGLGGGDSREAADGTGPDIGTRFVGVADQLAGFMGRET